MESQFFFFFFFDWIRFHTEKPEKEGQQSPNTTANLRNTETAARKYKESIKSCLAEEGVAP